jgi:2-amino-4-hydroxy-6-hydroxymethyldihydropteridine diphosphokinase
VVSAYISLGSNINPEENIEKALRLLSSRSSVSRVSKTWKTRAVGSNGPDFLNLAVEISTDLAVGPLKQVLLGNIEKELGRIRTSDKFAPRTIDLDIIIFDDQVLDTNLWEYFHVALPMAELLPDLKNPVSNQTLREVAEELKQRNNATPLS